MIIKIGIYRVIIVIVEEYLKRIIIHLEYFVNILVFFVTAVKWTIIMIIVVMAHDNNCMAELSIPPICTAQMVCVCCVQYLEINIDTSSGDLELLIGVDKVKSILRGLTEVLVILCLEFHFLIFVLV